MEGGRLGAEQCQHLLSSLQQSAYRSVQRAVMQSREPVDKGDQPRVVLVGAQGRKPHLPVQSTQYILQRWSAG